MLKSDWRSDEPKTAAEALARVRDVRSRLHRVPAAVVMRPNKTNTPATDREIEAIQRVTKVVAFRNYQSLARVTEHLASIRAAEEAKREYQARREAHAIASALDGTLTPLIANLVMQPGQRAKKILLETCEKHMISPQEIMSDRRTRRAVLARQEAMYRLRMETTWSLPRIGKFLGGKDHTTVLHGYRAHAKRYSLPLVETFSDSVKDHAMAEIAVQRAAHVAA